jgi:hypothetical protein
MKYKIIRVISGYHKQGFLIYQEALSYNKKLYRNIELFLNLDFVALKQVINRERKCCSEVNFSAFLTWKRA